MAEETKSSSKIWLIVGALLGSYILVLSVLSYYNPELKSALLKWVIGGVIAAVLSIAGYLFWFNRGSKIESKLQPEPIPFAEAQELADKIIKSPQYMDEFDRGNIEFETTEDVGEPASQIYYIICPGRLVKNNLYVVGINMNLPLLKRGVLVFNRKDYALNKTKFRADINRLVNRLPSHPKKEIPSKVTTVHNPATGISVVSEEPGIEENKKEEKKDELD